MIGPLNGTLTMTDQPQVSVSTGQRQLAPSTRLMRVKAEVVWVLNTRGSESEASKSRCQVARRRTTMKT